VVNLTAQLEATIALIEERAPANNQARVIDDEVLAAVARSGVNRMLLPAALGGQDAHPRLLVDAIARIAAADASTGWCAAVGASLNIFSGHLPESAAREIYADPDVGIAGMLAPMGVVTRTTRADGGVDATLTGRWPFASNSPNSAWIGLAALVTDGSEEDPTGRVVWVPTRDVLIEDTWHAEGLRATGSHHVRTQALPVDLTRSCRYTDSAWADGPLWQMPVFTVLLPVMVAAALGIARGAIDLVLDTARTASDRAMRGHLLEDPVGMADLAAADAALRAAHAGVVAAVDDVWTVAETATRASRLLQARSMLAVHHAIDVAVESVSVAHRLGGGSAAYAGHPLMTALLDVHTARQHISFGHHYRATLGRIAAGSDEQLPPFVV